MAVGLLLLGPSPVPLFLANASDLLANIIGDPLVHIRAVSKLEENLEMNEEWSENQSYTAQLVSGSVLTEQRSTKERTSNEIIEQGRGSPLVNTMAVELSDPGESVEATCNEEIICPVRKCGRSKKRQGELRHVEQLSGE
jgi:hypothetical protein